MMIALIGATGRAGSSILRELTSRGHTVTAIARNAEAAQFGPGITARNANIFDVDRLSAVVAGHDAAISAAWFWPGSSATLVEGIRRSGVRRALFVGGASSLLSNDGRMLVEVLDMPDDWMPTILEGIRLLETLRATPDLDWTFISPPLDIVAAPRRGTYRSDPDRLVIGSDGKSTISFDDYAIAMVDALEQRLAIHARFGVGY